MTAAEKAKAEKAAAAEKAKAEKSSKEYTANVGFYLNGTLILGGQTVKVSKGAEKLIKDGIIA